MATVNPAIITQRGRIFGALEKNWGWLLGLGVLFLILGLVGIGMAVALTIASLMVFGVLLLAGGVIQLIEAFKNTGWKSIGWHLLIAVLYIAAGIIVFTNPVLASKVFTLMLAGAILFIGIFRVVMALQHRGTAGWGWTLVAGLISIVLGVLIFQSWPVSALWLIGMFVAIDLIVSGWSYIFLALAARKAGQQALA